MCTYIIYIIYNANVIPYIDMFLIFQKAKCV